MSFCKVLPVWVRRILHVGLHIPSWGRSDDSRIEMVQFHQNYSYEDFIMGFKPQEDGSFRIEEGVSTNFVRGQS